MADFSDELKTRLKAIAGVTALVGSGTAARIYNDVLKQGVSLPAIVIYETGGESWGHLRGIGGLVRSVWHVIAYGSTRSAANELSEVIRTDALNADYRGLFGSTWVSSATCSSHRVNGYDTATDGSGAIRYWSERVYDIVHTEDTT